MGLDDMGMRDGLIGCGCLLLVVGVAIGALVVWVVVR